MKYYTKQWYNLMQKTDYTCVMKKIPDKNYSDEEIRKLYEKALKRTIAEEKKSYNEPPFFLFEAEDIDCDTVDLEDWIFVDEETGTIIQPETHEELKEHLQKEQMEEWAEFENRPPFDPAETIHFFEETYRRRVKCTNTGLPDWVLETVDRRLLALDLLPESVYHLLKKEEKANKTAVNEINKKGEREWRKQRKRIPDKVYEILANHDKYILSLKEQRGDVVMILRTDYIYEEGVSPYEKIVFSDVISFEREKGLRLHCQKDQENQEYYTSNCIYLYDELYVLEDGTYEFHFLVAAGELRYITIRCKDIQCQKNVKFEK